MLQNSLQSTDQLHTAKSHPAPNLKRAKAEKSWDRQRSIASLAKNPENNMNVYKLGNDEINFGIAFPWNTVQLLKRIRWLYGYDVENCPQYVFYIVFLLK